MIWFYALVAAQALDLVTFWAAVQRWGISGEMNPIIRLLYSDGGILGVGLFKALIVALAVFLFHAVYEQTGASAGWVVLMSVAILIGLLGAATNLWAVLM